MCFLHYEIKFIFIYVTHDDKLDNCIL